MGRATPSWNARSGCGSISCGSAVLRAWSAGAGARRMNCRFGNALVAGGVCDDLLAGVCRQIEGHGLKLRAAEAAIIDGEGMSAMCSSECPKADPERGPALHPCRGRAGPRRGRCARRRSGRRARHPFSADPDARWIKTGGKSTLGYKGFARTSEKRFNKLISKRRLKRPPSKPPSTCAAPPRG